MAQSGNIMIKIETEIACTRHTTENFDYFGNYYSRVPETILVEYKAKYQKTFRSLINVQFNSL